MSDEFQNSAKSILAPSENAFTVSPSDSVPLTSVSKYLYIGGAGRVTLRAKDADTDVTFENVPAGGYIYVRTSHVRASGTTATDIVACA